MITNHLATLFGQKLPCSVYTFKTLAKVLPLGNADWSNELYRAVQIEDIKKPWSGVEAIAKVARSTVVEISLKDRQTNLLSENRWFFCQHWNDNFTKGHSYFCFRNGSMYLIADSSEAKPAQINVYFGKMPITATYFKATAI